MPIFFIKHWRKIAGLIALGGIFAAGWNINGWRLSAKYAETEAAVIEAYEARQQELIEEYEKEQSAANRLQDHLLDVLRSNATRALELEQKLQAAQLALDAADLQDRGTAEITRERENGTETVYISVNPFGDDFVRLWNESADPDAGQANSPTTR